MTGINQGRPEAAVGEPIRLGSDTDYELEHHPISDRLIIRDTANGTEAYIKAESTAQIGNDGSLITSIKNGRPLADDGVTYSNVQDAERAASSWVFVPPGSFSESVLIETDGLTLQGCGYSSLVTTSSGFAIQSVAENVTVRDLQVNSSGGNTGVRMDAPQARLQNVHVVGASDDGIRLLGADNSIVLNCRVVGHDNQGIELDDSSQNCIINGCYAEGGSFSPFYFRGDNSVLANSIAINSGRDGINIDNNNAIVIGNRIINSTEYGINTSAGSSDTIIANNRISGSGTGDINDIGTGNLLDANLSGASN